ncbi:hypothetical protein WAX46_08150 [Bacillus sp. FJAT-53060]|uniref:hypothetical protein n=1 Tax=Bacillus sp. FJAT-53060 TaxID=3127666 RepID=UPI0030132DBB
MYSKQTQKELKKNINKIKSALYKLSKILGDVNAVQKGTIGKRIMGRAAGKASGKLMKKIFLKKSPLVKCTPFS